MRRPVNFALLILLILAAVPLRAQVYQPKTPEQIEAVRKQRHEFIEKKSKLREASIKRILREQAEREFGNQDDFDIQYYGIDIEIHFDGDSISAEVDCEIESLIDDLMEVTLNLTSQLNVIAVEVEGAEASYSHDAADDLLYITLPEPVSTGGSFEVRIEYSGVPVFEDYYGGMTFDSWYDHRWCSTSTQPYGSGNWFPCKDVTNDKADSLFFWITYPEDLDCAANGAIVYDSILEDGSKQMHCRHCYPIAPYLIALSCTVFDVDVHSWTFGEIEMPVYTYCNPEDPESFVNFRDTMPIVLDIFSDLFGVYPFHTEKAGNATYMGGGAMEHQTCSMYFPGFSMDWVIAHETAHQWWGDMITCETYHHMWLNEGFASYCEALYYEGVFGKGAYRDHMLSMAYYSGGTVFIEDPLVDFVFDQIVYDKGAWIVHMLREMIGDDVFFGLLRDYYDSDHKFGTATTEDFAELASSAAGEDLGWFFDQWVYGEGCPKIEASYVCERNEVRNGFTVSLLLEQTQEWSNLFRFELPYAMHLKSGFTEKGSVSMDGTTDLTALEIQVPDTVMSLDLDEYHTVLRTIDFVPFRLRITSRELSQATVDHPYSYQLEAFGADEPYSWSVVGGALPSGITLDTDGLLSGTPASTGDFDVTLQVADATMSESDTHTVALSVQGIPDYVSGDCNGSGGVDIDDIVYLIGYVFQGGPAPFPIQSGDVDCSAAIDIDDVVCLINYVFNGGPEPC